MWRKSYPYLNDEEFINLIDTQHLQKQYIKITLLDWDENPIQEIQGLATSGSISVNGDSAIRRTCNLTMVVKGEEFAISSSKNLISIGRKLFLEIGIENKTNKYKNEYPIVWFPQGLFVFTQCSLSNSVGQGTTLSAQLKDKMCLLNGECGGVLTSQIQFNKYDTIDTSGNWITSYPTIATIIRDAVNHLGGEQLGNILISDIDEKVKQIMRWTGQMPVYLINDGTNNILTTDYSSYQSAGIHEYQYGDDIGFIQTDFIYPNDLIANPGDNLCTAILDKIKSFLGNFEYFYDVFGIFRFQEIKDYLNTTQATVDISQMNNEDYKIDIYKGKSVYDFSNSKLITSFSNTPQYSRIKNDFVIWGTKKGLSGLDCVIRYHLAIDKKPQIGNTYDVYFYIDENDGLEKPMVPIEFDTFVSLQANQGYADQFYKTLNDGKIYIWKDGNYIEYTDVEEVTIKTTDWRSELYLQGVLAEPQGLYANDYYAELKAEWPKIYDLKANNEGNYYTGDFKDNILEYPWDVTYWLDFIDSDTAIGALSVKNIGRRSLSENKTDYNCVFEPEIPDFIFLNTADPDIGAKRQACIDKGQPFIQVDPGVYSLLSSGGGRNSCFERVKNALYDYTSYNSSISIGILPIYHLEPNTRITINSKENDMFGDYLIKSFSIPLTINGTMNISATQCNAKL